ncbi:MAG: hypothetical protein GX310_02005, partial [Synergistaceae bacterium]|nr:hypothetical protein [Synergistaceae bacterium]
NDHAVEMLAGRGIDGERITAAENPFAENVPPVDLPRAAGRPLICVVDSYEASPQFLAGLRSACKTVLIDDCRPRPVERECDILLNYNLNASSLGYESGHAGLLLGPGYALLRKSFWELAAGEGNTVLIIPGASDLLNTGRQFTDWWKADWPKAEIVLGPLVSPSLAEEIAARSRKLKNFSAVRDPADLPERLAKSRAVICTSSVTSYEALSLRKPLAVFQTADNQLEIGREIEKRGLGVNLGPWGRWGVPELRGFLENLPPPPKQAVNPGGALKAAEELLKRAR